MVNAHKVYLLVELLISGEVEDVEEGDREDRYISRDVTLNDVLDLSGDFARDLDKDIEDSIERSAYHWDDITVRASALGVLKVKPRNRLY